MICKCGHEKHGGKCDVITGVSDGKLGLNILVCECEITWQSIAREKCPELYDLLLGKIDTGAATPFYGDKQKCIEELRKLIER